MLALQEHWLSLDRSLRRRAAGRDRGLLCDPDRDGRPPIGGAADQRLRAVHRDPRQSRDAVHRARHLGATVMPHNLYLHSAIVQTRDYGAHRRRPPRGDQTGDDRLHHRADAGAVHQCRDPDPRGRDVPHEPARPKWPKSTRPHELLAPLLGLGIASTLFAVALLVSGLNSTMTATLAGQIVMEGFLQSAPAELGCGGW